MCDDIDTPIDLEECSQWRLTQLLAPLSPTVWSVGCDCTYTKRTRTIVERFDDCELWGCLQCRGLYWRPTAIDDYHDAPPISETDNVQERTA